MSISLLLPSRKRPVQIRRMIESARDTATFPDRVEVVARFDEDDHGSAEEARKCGAVVIIGPRHREITRMWNECFDVCHGSIVQQSNDDQVIVGKGWDVMVQNAFDEVPDKILLVHGNDTLGHGGNLAPTHSCIEGGSRPLDILFLRISVRISEMPGSTSLLTELADGDMFRSTSSISTSLTASWK